MAEILELHISAQKSFIIAASADFYSSASSTPCYFVQCMRIRVTTSWRIGRYYIILFFIIPAPTLIHRHVPRPCRPRPRPRLRCFPCPHPYPLPYPCPEFPSPMPFFCFPYPVPAVTIDVDAIFKTRTITYRASLFTPVTFVSLLAEPLSGRPQPPSRVAPHREAVLIKVSVRPGSRPISATDLDSVSSPEACSRTASSSASPCGWLSPTGGSPSTGPRKLVPAFRR